MLLVPRHLADDEQRRVPQLHHLARLEGECRDPLRVDLGHQRLDALGDGDAVLVELVLPQEAVHQRPLQRHFRREAPGLRALMREGLNDLVQLDHESLLLVDCDGKNGAGEQARAATAIKGRHMLYPLSYGLIAREDSNLRPCDYEVTALFTTGCGSDLRSRSRLWSTRSGNRRLLRPGRRKPAGKALCPLSYRRMERRTGFEPATSRVAGEVTALFTTDRAGGWRGTGDTVAALAGEPPFGVRGSNPLGTLVPSPRSNRYLHHRQDGYAGERANIGFQ